MSTFNRPLLVTGAGGMLGRAVTRVAQQNGVSVVGLSRSALDVTDLAAVIAAVREIKPSVIINLAAYTAVDRAEDEPARARTVNEKGAGNLATAARGIGARMVQISTDYVFDGRGRRPYRPTDTANPINVYGRTKWLGEQAVRATLPDHLIIRTSWLFAPWGQNFVRTIARRARENEPIRVVADQCGRPTSAFDLATVLLDVAGRPDTRGTIHFANSGATTWFNFAEAIVSMMAAGNGAMAEVLPVTTAVYPTRAARPAYSVLDTEDFVLVTGTVPRSWHQALSEIIAELE